MFFLAFSGLGVFPAIAVNDEDFGLSSFPRAYGSLTEKSVYHQNRVRGMKNDLNDYSGRVYDLRRRFDLIFRNRQTDLAPPVPFEVGEGIGLEDRGGYSNVTYQGPEIPDRFRRTEPPAARPVADVTAKLEGSPVETTAKLEADDEKSPLAFVVEGPSNVPQVQEQGVEEPGIRRKLEYYILPRFGISLPSDDDYATDLSFAVSSGLVQGDWRIGVDFSYSSNDFSTTRELVPGFHTPEKGDIEAYALLVNVTRDIPLGANWIGSVGVGVGGGWSRSESTIYVFPAKEWEEQEGDFAWQLGLGARRLFGESSSVFLGYRYLGHPEMSTHNFEAGAEVGF